MDQRPRWNSGGALAVSGWDKTPPPVPARPAKRLEELQEDNETARATKHLAAVRELAATGSSDARSLNSSREPSGSASADPSLIFDGSSFESANLGSATLVATNPEEYDLCIRSDTFAERHKIWFYFSVRGARAGQRVIFHVLGYSKNKALFRDGMAPVVCSSGQPYWERMEPGSVYFYRSPRHNKAYVLSFPFCFERTDEIYYFAFCFPYTHSYLQRFLDAIEAKSLAFFRRELLCHTLQGRRCDLLTISSAENLRLDAALRDGDEALPTPLDSGGRPLVRHVVFISARVHPGESPASFMMHGLINFVLSEHPRAVALREAVILKVVPMLNPDGVFLGNYRCNSVGLDLNRAWHLTAEGNAPTIDAMRKAAASYCQHPLCRLQMVLDMHAHSTCFNGFIFANQPDNPRDVEEVAAFPRVLGMHAKDFASSSCKLDADPSKVGTGRRALSEMLPGVHCYTLEVSMFCAMVGNLRTEVYRPSSYTEMGQAVGLALHDHLCSGINGRLNGSVPPPPQPSTPAPAAAHPIRAAMSPYHLVQQIVRTQPQAAASSTPTRHQLSMQRRSHGPLEQRNGRSNFMPGQTVLPRGGVTRSLSGSLSKQRALPSGVAVTANLPTPPQRHASGRINTNAASGSHLQARMVSSDDGSELDCKVDPYGVPGLL